MNYMQKKVTAWIVMILAAAIMFMCSSCVYAPGDDDEPPTCDDIEDVYDERRAKLEASCIDCDLTDQIKEIERERISKLRAIGCQTRR